MQIADRKLPGLALAFDAETMRSRLAQFVAPQAERNELRIKLLKHAPGKRCVIAYRWEAEHEAVPRLCLLGKMYRKERGRAVYENMQQLWQAATRANFEMAEPLGYLPELGMVLQRFLTGRRLADFSASEDLPKAIHHTAVNLAALHSIAVSHSETRGIDEHLRKYCHPGPEVLLAACPESAQLVESLLAGLHADKTLALAPLVPVHGDLNLAQIFIKDERAWFIDFDGFCLSHAALDAGNFLVTLQVHFPQQYDALAQAFWSGYFKSRSPHTLSGLQTYQAFAYLRRAVICARAPEVPGWRQHVRKLLEAGNAMVG